MNEIVLAARGLLGASSFWGIQPVFHYGDIGHWFGTPHIVHAEPPMTPFVQMYNDAFETLDARRLQEHHIMAMMVLLGNHYLRNGDNRFMPTAKSVMAYFRGHTESSYWTLLWTAPTFSVVEGCITSRPVRLYLSASAEPYLVAYYVDYLCVATGTRGKGVAPRIIQTHEYLRRQFNPHIRISVFKREGDLTNIVPLTSYTTSCFKAAAWRMMPAEMGKNAVACTDLSEAYAFTTAEALNRCRVCIFSDFDNWCELVAAGNLMIVTDVPCNVRSTAGQKTRAVFFFRRSLLFLSKDQEVVDCLASIRRQDMPLDEFVTAFHVAVAAVLRPHRTIAYVSIEAVGDNVDLITPAIVHGGTPPYIVSPTAYFLYNYIHPTVPARECFIMM